MAKAITIWLYITGAFLIPYAIMLAVEGLPIVFLELAIGQRLRKGAIGVWAQISPNLGGIGIASTVVSFNVALYYNTIIAWCLYYLFQVSNTCILLPDVTGFLATVALL